MPKSQGGSEDLSGNKVGTYCIIGDGGCTYILPQPPHYMATHRAVKIMHHHFDCSIKRRPSGNLHIKSEHKIVLTQMSLEGQENRQTQTNQLRIED